jgi:hypothetical protein
MVRDTSQGDEPAFACFLNALPSLCSIFEIGFVKESLCSDSINGEPFQHVGRARNDVVVSVPTFFFFVTSGTAKC